MGSDVKYEKKPRYYTPPVIHDHFIMGWLSGTEKFYKESDYHALEAERDALRELLREANDYMMETGEVPLHLARRFQALTKGGNDGK